VGLDLVIDFLREKISPNNTIPVNLAPDKLYLEAVEKVNLDRIRRVGRKCDLSGCSVHGDFTLGRG